MPRPIAPVVGILGGIALVAAAASTAPPARALTVRAAATVADTVTGCLQKGTKAGVYKLAEANGQSINVKSSSVQLGGHVGHTVTLTTSTTPMSGDTTVASVSKMKMVSGSCS
jgi:hypothetical protein